MAGASAALLLAAIRIACYLRGAVLSGIRRRAVGGAGDGRQRELAVQVGRVEGVLLGGVHSIGLPTAVRRRPRSLALSSPRVCSSVSRSSWTMPKCCSMAARR